MPDDEHDVPDDDEDADEGRAKSDSPPPEPTSAPDERPLELVEPPFMRAMREEEDRLRDLYDPPFMRAMREQEERFRDLYDPPHMRAMREQEERLRNLFDPPHVRAMHEQEERFRDVLDPPFMKVMREQQARLSGFAKLHANPLQALTPFGQSVELFSRATSVLVSALRAGHLDAHAEQSAIAAVGLSKLAAEVTEPAFQAVGLVLSSGIALLEAPLDEAPTQLAGVITAEVFRALDLDINLRSDRADAARDERDVLLARTSDELELAVANFDPELKVLLAGARQALRSDNPDRVRHLCISLRELLGHVLRRLAPDAAVREWTADPKHYHNGSPTRGARLGFLYRHVAISALRELIDADVRATLELVDALNKGSHAVSLSANSAGMTLLMTRAEGTLLLLLRLEASRDGGV